ncbi:MAG: ATP-binding protein [Thiobacillus sp.]
MEFKENDAEPQAIGEYISALANGAALIGKASAYLVWGVKSQDHEIVGTSFQPQKANVGNEELENWLLRLLEPKIDFRFHETRVDDSHVILLEIARASRHPVRFSGSEYIRVGSYKKKLKDFPEKERALWRIFDETPFEDLIALENVSGDEVLRLLDFSTYFDLLNHRLPATRDGILDCLCREGLIRVNDANAWDITHLGAILLAKKLNDFIRLKRKAIRVIQYRGSDRTDAVNEQEGRKGYASGFEGLLSYINDILPSNEVMGQALRKTVPMFPELAVRELVANALIHQEFSMTGAAPMVEIFDDRIEITNPGEPLVDTQRFLDTPPKSRNEKLASMMRRFGICEERGSGIDKVVFQVELYQLPAPLFEVPAGSTRSVLFAHKELKDMDKPDRIRACYLHACLRYVSRQSMTNGSVRQRFGIDERNAAYASRLLNEALEAELIVIEDPTVGTRSRSYIPFWAGSKSTQDFA